LVLLDCSLKQSMTLKSDTFKGQSAPISYNGCLGTSLFVKPRRAICQS
jgi:hypothetical protein